MRKSLAFATLAVVAALASPSKAAETCPVSVAALKAFPGPPIGSWYSEARGKLPANPACLDPKEIDGCEIRGASGYVYTFGQREDLGDPKSGKVIRRNDRWMYQKSATAGRVAHLPLGVRWSDSQSMVTRKMAALGLALRPAVSAADPQGARHANACFSAPTGETFWLGFDFKAGRLTAMTQVGQYT